MRGNQRKYKNGPVKPGMKGRAAAAQAGAATAGVVARQKSEQAYRNVAGKMRAAGQRTRH